MVDYKDITKALKALYGTDVCYGKGGFWIKGHNFITLAKARQLTGLKATSRPHNDKISPYGDYATIAMINGIK